MNDEFQDQNLDEPRKSQPDAIPRLNLSTHQNKLDFIMPPYASKNETPHNNNLTMNHSFRSRASTI